MTIARQVVYNYYALKIESVTNPLDKLPAILKKNLHRNLCTCNEVPKMDIINAIVNGATTVSEIKKQTYATLGSGCCTQQVKRLIDCLCSPETDE
ncbi:MAG: (2Fe-2S)-binding protein [Methylococcales bacterium]